jgi:hypothetical protein
MTETDWDFNRCTKEYVKLEGRKLLSSEKIISGLSSKWKMAKTMRTVLTERHSFVCIIFLLHSSTEWMGSPLYTKTKFTFATLILHCISGLSEIIGDCCTVIKEWNTNYCSHKRKCGL